MPLRLVSRIDSVGSYWTLPCSNSFLEYRMDVKQGMVLMVAIFASRFCKAISLGVGMGETILTIAIGLDYFSAFGCIHVQETLAFPESVLLTA